MIRGAEIEAYASTIGLSVAGRTVLKFAHPPNPYLEEEGECYGPPLFAALFVGSGEDV